MVDHGAVFVIDSAVVLVVVACRQLAGTPHEPHLRLLETFAYGNYTDAQANADQLPKLTGAQVRLWMVCRCLTMVDL